MSKSTIMNLKQILLTTFEIIYSKSGGIVNANDDKMIVKNM